VPDGLTGDVTGKKGGALSPPLELQVAGRLKTGCLR
jgi:hypothetical protein